MMSNTIGSENPIDNPHITKQALKFNGLGEAAGYSGDDTPIDIDMSQASIDHVLSALKRVGPF